ncbi:hypothetical protein EJB05_34371 [Eragrostis curvula]|uniref:Uncharacterized protein n=1 Tax=Eragrostis curvula TaxID=38414 RepID=A0A5J9U3I2_9POAL|nr:hypothetical protein EJB05_34371 [Eragrostis curvula]
MLERRDLFASPPAITVTGKSEQSRRSSEWYAGSYMTHGDCIFVIIARPTAHQEEAQAHLAQPLVHLKETTRLCRRVLGGGVTEDDEASGPNSEKKGKGSRETSLLEDLAVAVRRGAETLKSALRRIYMTRASTYTDALKNFVESY